MYVCNFNNLLRNCSTDLYNRDLQTTKFTSHAMYLSTRLTEFFLNFRCLLLSFISHGKQSNECTCRKVSLPSRNLCKCKQVACSVVVTCLFAYPHFLYCFLFLPVYFLVHSFIPMFCCLFTPLYHFFILMLLLYFYLFVDHVKKTILLVFKTFFYYFNNTIFIKIYTKSI